MQRAALLCAVLFAGCGAQVGSRDPDLGSTGDDSSSLLSTSTKPDGGTTVCKEDVDDDDDVSCKDDDRDHGRGRDWGRDDDRDNDRCKARICHGPAGQLVTITVSTRALKAHMRHGDTMGKCKKCPPPPPICPPPPCRAHGQSCTTTADCCVQTPVLFCQIGAGSVCLPGG